MNQYITDLEGNLLEVTDLKEAIFQVAMYMTYLHNVPTQDSQHLRSNVIYTGSTFIISSTS